MTTTRFLNNGVRIPLLGLGTYRVKCDVNKDQVFDVVDVALGAGYKLIDTACGYGNEKDIGSSLQKLCKKYEIKREDLFIISKLAPNRMSYEAAITTCKQTLTDLQCDYIDCYLVHWPGTMDLPAEDRTHSRVRKAVWGAFEYLCRKGFTKSIGVSNYTKAHLEELLTYANIRPVLNQVEFHPHLHQKNLLKFCHDHNIFLQAYSPLATGKLIHNKTICELARKYDCFPSCVLLKWALQQNVGVIPKSTNSNHIVSNIELDDINIIEEDMLLINTLNIDKHYCWNPSQMN